MFSEKQLKILAFPYTSYSALICDGAIRSGKTRIMTVAFVDWAMRSFSGTRFGICAKTIDSAVKNIIQPYMEMYWHGRDYKLKWRRTDKVLEVRRGERVNYFEVFGGLNEASFSLIQGRTLGGVLLDEVALMPKSFVQQAIARCSEEGARLWFSCNPDTPQHWFYKEWIIRAEERNALHICFSLEDNPSLSEQTLARYKSSYTGAFYERYILGRWIAAEGLVYELPKDAVTEDIPQGGEYYISCDYGTLNPFSAGLWCLNDGVATRIAEYYHDGRESGVQLTDEEYYTKLVKLAGEREIRAVIVDPSAASFITLIKRKGRFRVKKARNDVLNGIRLTACLIKNGRVKIHCTCKDALREFSLYRWDPSAETDRVIKENDHAMDDIRYFCYTIIKRSDDSERDV